MHLRSVATLLLLVTTVSGSLKAQARHDSLQFAGVAYLGDAAQLDVQFPVARAVERLAERKGSPLLATLRAALLDAGVPLRIDLAQRAGLAVVFAFDDEYRSVEAFSGVGFKIVSSLSGQLLTMNFEEGFATVLTALPATIEYVDARSTRPDAGYDDEVAAALFATINGAGKTGQFAQMARTYASLPAPSTAICRVRLADVTFDSVTVRLASQRFGNDTARLRSALAREIARTWVTAARQPLLPIRSSQAEGLMQARFANGEIYRLRVPEPDYLLAINDVRSRRAVAGSNSAMRIDAVGAQLTASVIEPHGGAIAARGVFRIVILDTIAQLRTETDTWAGVHSSVSALTAKLGAAARRADKEWFDANDATRTSYFTLPPWLKKCAP